MGTGTLTLTNIVSGAGLVFGSFDTGTLIAPDIQSGTVQIGGQATTMLTDFSGTLTTPIQVLPTVVGIVKRDFGGRRERFGSLSPSGSSSTGIGSA